MGNQFTNTVGWSLVPTYYATTYFKLLKLLSGIYNSICYVGIRMKYLLVVIFNRYTRRYLAGISDNQVLTLRLQEIHFIEYNFRRIDHYLRKKFVFQSVQFFHDFLVYLAIFDGINNANLKHNDEWKPVNQFGRRFSASNHWKGRLFRFFAFLSFIKRSFKKVEIIIKNTIE